MKRSMRAALPDPAADDDMSSKKHKMKAVASDSQGPAPLSVYRFEKVIFATLKKRFTPFLADVILDNSGETIVAYSPNSGPLYHLLGQPSPKLMLTKSPNPKRKYNYTMEAVQLVEDSQQSWIGIHCSLANKMVHHMLKEKMIPQFVDFDKIRPEVTFGKDKKSRADFLLSCSDSDRKMYVEVKAVSYAEKRGDTDIALFPDTNTARGRKHLQELINVVESGDEAACVFVVLGNPCTAVGPYNERDPGFAELMKEGYNKGMEVIGIRLEYEFPTDKDCDFVDFVFKRFLDIELNA